jgi:hypothetical protein
MDQTPCRCKHPEQLHGQIGCAIDGCICYGFHEMTEQQYQHWVSSNDC